MVKFTKTNSIDAVQWNGRNYEEIALFLRDHLVGDNPYTDVTLHIRGLSVNVDIKKGDWVCAEEGTVSSVENWVLKNRYKRVD